MMNRRHVLAALTGSLTSLTGCLGDTEYQISDLSVPEQAGPLILDVPLVDSEATVSSPAHLEFALHNVGGRELRIRNTGIWPLGVLALAPSGERKPLKILLISDKYDQTDHIERSQSEMHLDNVPLVQSLAAGETVTERYTLHGDDIYRTGVHILRGYFDEVPLSYQRRDKESWTMFSPKITVTIKEWSLFS